MKKTKLLFPILGVPALMTTLIPTVVSCSPTSDDPTGDEEIIMPDVAAQEVQYNYDEDFGGVYSYIIIRGFKWNNPKHIFRGIYANAKVGNLPLDTEIISSNDSFTFDVKISIFGPWNSYPSGTTLDIDLSIWSYDSDFSSIKISENKNYSMILKSGILLVNTNYTPDAMGTSKGIVSNAIFYILNGPHIVDEVQNVTIDELPSEYGSIGKIEFEKDYQKDYYCEINVSFEFSNYVLNYNDGINLHMTAVCSTSTGDTWTSETTTKSFSTPIVNVLQNRGDINLNKTDELVYEGDSGAIDFTWANPESPEQTAGNLTWETSWDRDELGIKSIEVSPSTSNKVHFKFVYEKEPSIQAPDLDFWISYKNIPSNEQNLSVGFIINE